jgi:mono/diheme cytochrome c family protein
MRLTMMFSALSLALIVALATVPRAQTRSVADGAYTEAQAERGKTAYEAQCSFCHLSDLTGQGFAPGLVDDTFKARWAEGDLGELYTIVKVTMPQDKPDSLTPEEYAAIVAYMLKMNDYPAGKQELVADEAALKNIKFKK